MDESLAPSSPVHKKRRADGQSWDWKGKSSKVCIPLYCYASETQDLVECNVCVVDLSVCEEGTDAFSHSPTTLKIKYVPDGETGAGVRDGFCALGNKVYIFDSCLFKEKKAIYSFDISAASQTPLLKSDLTKMGEMLIAKYNPAALVVPNTCKILIFPKEVYHKRWEMSSIIGGFELYDTVEGSLRELPLLDITVPVRKTYIQTYGFLDTHRVMVQIRGKDYVLDLDLLDKGWVSTASWVDRLAASSRSCSTSFDIVENRFCISTCGGVRDLQIYKEKEKEMEKEKEKTEKEWDIPDPSYLWVLSRVKSDINTPRRRLTLVNHDEQAGESCICILTMDGYESPKKSFRMQFDVVVLDLKLYKQARELHGNSNLDYTTPVNSLRYSLNLQGAEYKVFPCRTFCSF